jgi:hypothetical protein
MRQSGQLLHNGIRNLALAKIQRTHRRQIRKHRLIRIPHALGIAFLSGRRIAKCTHS